MHFYYYILFNSIIGTWSYISIWTELYKNFLNSFYISFTNIIYFLAISFDFSQLYSNLFSDTLNLGIVLTSMFAATIIYIPITLYIERIVYGENGVPLPFYFPFIVRNLFYKAIKY